MLAFINNLSFGELLVIAVFSFRELLFIAIFCALFGVNAVRLERHLAKRRTDDSGSR